MKLVFLLLIFFISLPGFSQEDENDAIEKLQAAKKKQAETMQQILMKQNSASEQNVSNLPPEIQKLGYKNFSVAALSDERVIKHLKKMFESSPLISMSDKDVQALLRERLKGSALEGFFNDNPQVVACLADILKDKKAMPEFLGIMLRKTDLFLYMLIWICLMLMGRCLRKMLLIEEMGRLKRNLVSMAVSLTVMSASFYSFYKIFEKELSPTVTIVMNHLESGRS